MDEETKSEEKERERERGVMAKNRGTDRERKRAARQERVEEGRVEFDFREKG